MLTSDFVRLVHGRRIGKGKWVAKCPGHPDRKPSLSICEGRKGTLIKCMSAGCDTKDILIALGLKYSDLFFESEMSPEKRLEFARRSFESFLYENELRIRDLKMFLRGVEMPPHRRLIRTKSRFECDLEWFTQKILLDNKSKMGDIGNGQGS